MNELQLFVQTTLLAIGALLPIVDPLAGAPIYLALTGDLAADHRKTLAAAVARDSFLLLLGSMLLGAYVLDFFGISVPTVRVAGGIVVCAMAWSLLNQPETETPESGPRNAAAQGDPRRILRQAFYPLTMPLTVGPGSISVAITLGANPAADVRTQAITVVGHVAGALVVAGSVYLCYRYAEAIVARLGETGRTVVMRLSAFLLLCIGVQIAWNGIRVLLKEALT